MSFSHEMRERNRATWDAVVRHPFVEQIVESTLPHANFRFYIHQDSWFLREESKVLGIAASRASDLATAGALAELVTSVNQAEQSRHRRFAEQLGDPIDTPALTPAPTAYAYVAHLRSVALDGALVEILAALLPCPWVYRNFGQHHEARVPDDPIYRDWLSAYQSPLLDDRVQYQCDLLDRSAAEADAATRARAAQAFGISIRYEHAFWDMAMAQEAWA
jgi:thiaminase II